MSQTANTPVSGRSPRAPRRASVVLPAMVAIATLVVLDPSVALAAESESSWSWQMQWLGAAVNVAIILWLIMRFGRPGVRKFLGQRQQTIDADIAEAEALRKQAELRLEELEAKMASLDAEREQILTDYRAIGEAEKERLIEQATKDAERIRKDAGAFAEAESARARLQLEREITQRAIELAEQKLRAEMQPARQKDLIEQTIGQLDALGGGASARPTGGFQLPTS